jgi:alpha-1,2-mannosyltransferase
LWDKVAGLGFQKGQIVACLTLLALALLAAVENSGERAFATSADLIPFDFPVFYLGGKVALERGRVPLYDPPADRRRGYELLCKSADPASAWAQLGRASGFPQVLQFTNPPFSAVIMAPLALLPWRSAYLLWQCITILLTAASIVLALNLVSCWPSLPLCAGLFAAACFFFPFRSTLMFGQVNASILFLWTLGVFLLKRERPMASGICFALGTVLKVVPIVAVSLFILRRQWRWLGAYVAGAAAFTGVSIWQLGWRTNLQWLTAVYPSIASGVGTVSNRSLAGLLNLIGVPHYFPILYADTGWPVPAGLALLEKVCSVAILLGFYFWCWRRRRDGQGLIDELILLPLLYLLAAPFTWPHHYVLAILPLVYLWTKVQDATRAEALLLSLSTLAIGTELPMYVACYSSLKSANLVILSTALWPAATCALIWLCGKMSVAAAQPGGSDGESRNRCRPRGNRQSDQDTSGRSQVELQGRCLRPRQTLD